MEFKINRKKEMCTGKDSFDSAVCVMRVMEDGWNCQPRIESFRLCGKEYLRKGYGKALMELVKDELRSMGYECLYVSPCPENMLDGNLALSQEELEERYESYGFEYCENGISSKWYRLDL